MQMVIGCGRGISGMAKNHIKTNIIGWQCAVKPHVTCGTTKTVVPIFLKSANKRMRETQYPTFQVHLQNGT